MTSVAALWIIYVDLFTFPIYFHLMLAKISAIRLFLLPSDVLVQTNGKSGTCTCPGKLAVSLSIVCNLLMFCEVLM
jgi:hypothetical protein